MPICSTCVVQGAREINYRLGLHNAQKWTGWEATLHSSGDREVRIEHYDYEMHNPQGK